MFSEFYRLMIILGLILIVIGVAVVGLAILFRYMPAIEKLPKILVYTYRRDGFFFVTSPILIIISIASFFFFFWRFSRLGN